MKSYKAILVIPLLAIMSQPVMAHYNHDGYTKFDNRIERQHKRIKKGVRNDQLTKKETKKLRKQHRHIKKLNKHFLKDGYLSRQERRTLQRELDLASKRIYRLKHNNRYRQHALHDKRYGTKKHYSHYQKHRDHKTHRLAVINKRYYD